MTRLALTMLAVACGGSPPPPARAITSADLTPSASGPPRISDVLLEQRRTAGDREIVPDGDVMDVMRNRGIGRVVGAFTYCVDETGHVTSVTTVKTTSVVPYDQKIEREIRDWAFAPVIVDGHATAACSAAAFSFIVR
jgi:hypothetical protein